jgi:hypothetical protein
MLLETQPADRLTLAGCRVLVGNCRYVDVVRGAAGRLHAQRHAACVSMEACHVPSCWWGRVIPSRYVGRLQCSPLRVVGEQSM